MLKRNKAKPRPTSCNNDTAFIQIAIHSNYGNSIYLPWPYTLEVMWL